MFLFRYVQSANKWVKIFSNLYIYLVGYLIFQSIILVVQIWAYEVGVMVDDGGNVTYGVYSSNPDITMFVSFDVSCWAGRKFRVKCLEI